MVIEFRMLRMCLPLGLGDTEKSHKQWCAGKCLTFKVHVYVCKFIVNSADIEMCSNIYT